MTEVWDNDDQSRAIEVERANLTGGLNDMFAGLITAEHAVKALRSDEVYDVEYAESMAGDDVAEHLRVAGRAIRAALALHRELMSS